MRGRVNAAAFYPRYRGDGQLVLDIDSHQQEAVAEWAETYKAGDVDINRVRQKRSLDANAYLWVLCDKIAERLNMGAEEVYKELVRRVGVFEDLLVYDTAKAAFQQTWATRGIGWFTAEMPSRINGATKLRAYIGSSVYDTKQMSRLIDEAVSEAKSMGIETMTPDQLGELIERWGE